MALTHLRLSISNTTLIVSLSILFSTIRRRDRCGKVVPKPVRSWIRTRESERGVAVYGIRPGYPDLYPGQRGGENGDRNQKFGAGCLVHRWAI